MLITLKPLSNNVIRQIIFLTSLWNKIQTLDLDQDIVHSSSYKYTEARQVGLYVLPECHVFLLAHFGLGLVLGADMNGQRRAPA